MSNRLTPSITIATPTRIDRAGETTAVPAFRAARRAMIRLQAAHTTRRMLRELTAVGHTSAPGEPLFVRLDALRERYADLGGDPASIDAPVTPGRATLGAVVVRLRHVRDAVEARHDAYVRGEIAECHERAAQRYEVGGDFSVLP